MGKLLFSFSLPQSSWKMASEPKGNSHIYQEKPKLSLFRTIFTKKPNFTCTSNPKDPSVIAPSKMIVKDPAAAYINNGR